MSERSLIARKWGPFPSILSVLKKPSCCLLIFTSILGILGILGVGLVRSLGYTSSSPKKIY
jgi:hypothetical protein